MSGKLCRDFNMLKMTHKTIWVSKITGCYKVCVVKTL